ncbi:MAG TPA: hypothetical protein PLY86_20510 [bacterium]|nr:hypothetical protein [bacterium]
MDSVLEIFDRKVAELKAQGRLSEPSPSQAQTPVQVETVATSEPSPAPPLSLPVSQPVEVSTLPPSTLSADEVRQAIDTLIRHCTTWGDLPIGEYIRDHRERWRTRKGLPGIADELCGMVEMMIELHPDQGSRIPTEAARAVCSWIEYRDLERISNQEYRDRLAQCWNALRK